MRRRIASLITPAPPTVPACAAVWRQAETSRLRGRSPLARQRKPFEDERGTVPAGPRTPTWSRVVALMMTTAMLVTSMALLASMAFAVMLLARLSAARRGRPGSS